MTASHHDPELTPPSTARLTAPVTVSVTPLRAAGAAMLAVGAAWSVLPVHPPACPLRSLTGIPCPLCGASRGAAAALRGDVLTGLAWNPLGVLAVVVALALLIGWVLRWRPATLRAPVWLPVVALAATWAYNLLLNPHF